MAVVGWRGRSRAGVKMPIRRSVHRDRLRIPVKRGGQGAQLNPLIGNLCPVGRLTGRVGILRILVRVGNPYRIDRRDLVHRFRNHQHRVQIAVLVQVHLVPDIRVVHDALAKRLDNQLLKLCGVGLFGRRDLLQYGAQQVRQNCGVQLVGQVHGRGHVGATDADHALIIGAGKRSYG